MLRVLLLGSLLLTSCATRSAKHDHTSEERKLIGLLEKFDRFDYNGNGSLSRKEIQQGLLESGTEGVTSEEVGRAFTVIDTDRNGQISLSEANSAEISEVGHQH